MGLKTRLNLVSCHTQCYNIIYDLYPYRGSQPLEEWQTSSISNPINLRTVYAYDLELFTITMVAQSTCACVL